MAMVVAAAAMKKWGGGVGRRHDLLGGDDSDAPERRIDEVGDGDHGDGRRFYFRHRGELLGSSDGGSDGGSGHGHCQRQAIL